MPRSSKFRTRSLAGLLLLSLCAAALFAGSEVARGQESLRGDWKASLKADRAERIHLSFEPRDEQGRRHQNGSDFDYSSLQGLTREQARAGGPVRFSLVREAGIIECEGSFQDGKGSGTFRFTANPAFVTGMRARGFDFEQQPAGAHARREPAHRLFTATVLDITTALADDLLSADFGKLGVEDLFKAAIFKVDAKFMREMKASGFPNLGMEELVKARIFKIDAEFVKGVAGLGFEKEPFESLVKMQIFKVTPQFVADARSEGLSILSVEELVKMRIFNIDRDFIRQAKADGVPLEVEQLVQKRIGVWNRRGH